MTERTTFDIPTLLSQLPSSSYKALGDDFFLAHLTYDESMDFMKYPVRFDGFLVFFCIEGNFNLDINLHSYEVGESSLIIYTPGNIVRVKNADPEQLGRLNFIIVASSDQFISDLKVDFSKLYEDSLLALETPCIKLSSGERSILKGYFDLTETLISSGIDNADKAIKSLGSSIFYLMGSLWKNRLDSAKLDRSLGTARSSVVYETFLKLVAEYHSSHKDVSFYADKLLVSPKYLSKLIKKVSGRTAAQWIDAFEVLDAKNMLKYSDLSIKEIAYKLNFASVPSFYKFFSKHVGMTPASYREL